MEVFENFHILHQQKKSISTGPWRCGEGSGAPPEAIRDTSSEDHLEKDCRASLVVLSKTPPFKIMGLYNGIILG